MVTTKCSDGSFCCGRSNQTCCDRKLGVTLAATLGQTSTTSTPSSSSTSSSSGSATSTTSASASSERNSSTAVGVGVGIGVPVVLIALSLAGWCLWRSHQRRRLSPRIDDDGLEDFSKPELGSPTSGVPFTSPPSAQSPLSDPVSQPTAIHEVDGTNGRPPVSEVMSRQIQAYQHP